MRIGFLGLGNMGSGMSRNLIRAGNQVTVYNRTRKAADTLAKDGARVTSTPAEAASGQEVAITMLADDHALESVAFGKAGLIEGLPPGAMHISMSTISPELSQRLAAAHKEHRQEYIAALVFGRPDAAAAAKLFIVTAGPKDAVAKAKPLFEVLGQRTFEVGERPEQANLTKLFGNFLITCVMEGLGEVFAAARKADIDPKTVFEVLSGTLFSAPAYITYGPKIIDEQFSPPGFRLPLGLKDIRLLLQAADKLAVPMPFASVVRDRFLAALAHGHADLDWSAIALGAAESAGLSSGTAGSEHRAAD
jgi:3-hydroxyisobutyrate dehydrogenase-like beta-hydroxyacid dehydrogenase